MNVLASISIAFRSLIANKLRAGLTMLGIIIGVAAVIALVAAGAGAQAQVAEAGIRLRIQSHDWGTFFGDIKAGNFQLYSLTWVGLKTPDSYRYLFHSAAIPPASSDSKGEPLPTMDPRCASRMPR